jgi:hypothetical protein
MESWKDVRRILGLLGLAAPFAALGFIDRLVDDLAEVVYILTGERCLPRKEDLRKAMVAERLGVIGIEPDNIVWNVWFAFDRISLSPRGTLLRLVSSKEVLDLANDIIQMQLLWFSGNTAITLALQELKDEGVPGVTSVLPWTLTNNTRTFQSFEQEAERKFKPKASPVAIDPSIGFGLPPPPPPPPPRRLLVTTSGNVTGSMSLSVEEREAAYSSGEVWPRCHVGWVCKNATTHCLYRIPGMSSYPRPDEIDPSRVCLRLWVVNDRWDGGFAYSPGRGCLLTNLLRVWKGQEDVVTGRRIKNIHELTQSGRYLCGNPFCLECREVVDLALQNKESGVDWAATLPSGVEFPCKRLRK